MAKLRNQPITAAELEKYLSTADDFAFELKCLHSLSERTTIRMEHGGTYTDPVSGKHRQFDIRANIEVVPLRVSLAIECKNLSPAYPLLVSRVPRIESEAFHQLLIPEPESDLGGGFGLRVPSLVHSNAESISAPASLYKTGDLVGKSVSRIGVIADKPGEFQADDSEIFDRWAQAVASAYDLISEADRYFSNDDSDPRAYWIVPVLVVPEGTLWVADYAKKGAVQAGPHQVDEVEIYLDHSAWKKGEMFSYTISHLHFVTAKGLLQLVDRILLNDRFRRQILPPSSDASYPVN
jgi:hypothetical protein